MLYEPGRNVPLFAYLKNEKSKKGPNHEDVIEKFPFRCVDQAWTPPDDKFSNSFSNSCPSWFVRLCSFSATQESRVMARRKLTSGPFPAGQDVDAHFLKKRFLFRHNFFLSASLGRYRHGISWGSRATYAVRLSMLAITRLQNMLLSSVQPRWSKSNHTYGNYQRFTGRIGETYN